jgi:uncharacterized membrane protein YbjE (DUF340 family)
MNTIALGTIFAFLCMVVLLAIGVATGWYSAALFPAVLGLVGAAGFILGIRIGPHLFR